MANFRTHAAVGIVASGMLSTLAMTASIVPPNDLVTLALAGTLGAILPDIDLEKSRASQAMFAGLGLFMAFAFLFNVSWKYSIAEMWIVWVGTYLLVRYLGHSIFHKYTVHRGIFHSLLAAAFFACLTAAVYHHVFAASITLCWMTGAFVFAGYVIHLILDEIYSVDFTNDRIKRSFGTALKLFEYRKPGASLAMAAALVIAYLAAPSPGEFIDAIASQDMWAMLRDRMLPDGSWFGFIAGIDQLAAVPPAGTP